MMKINRFFYNAACALLMGSMLMTAMGCPDKDAGTKKEVTSCGELTKEDDCNLSKQKDQKKCIYHGGKCEVLVQGGGGQTPTGKCDDLGADAAKCGLRMDCAIVSGKCADAASDCGNVKDQNACGTAFGKYCVWTPGAAGAADACVAKTPAVTTKKVRSYELAKIGKGAVDPANYGAINDVDLAGISASLNGDFVYIAGTAAMTLLAREVTNPGDAWANVSAAWANITDAKDASADVTFNAKAVVKFAPLSDGLMFSTTGANGTLAQVKGKGGNDVGIQGWEKTDAGLKNDNQAPQAIASVKNGVNEFIYFSHHNAPNNVMFTAKKVIPAGVNAADGLSNVGFVPGQVLFDSTLANTKRYKQILQIQNGDLLMVAQNGLSVDRLAAASVGVTAQDVAANGMVDYFEADDGNALHRVGGHDNEIGQCAVVDKYIVCGSVLTNPAEDGGIAVYDTTGGAAIDAAASWRWLTDGAIVAHDFKGIAVDLHDPVMKNKRALILVKDGFYIFEDGDLVAPFEASASKLINHSKMAIAADVAGFDTARSGFAAASTAAFPLAAGANQAYVGAAQDANGIWYIAVKGHGNADGGIFTLNITETPFTK